MNTFIELAKQRYSVRAYKQTPVEDEKINEILSAAMLAPTARNNQPQKIFVVKSESMRKRLGAVCPCTFDAPVIFVVCYDQTLASGGIVYPGYNFGNTDAAIVCSHMMFRATELGLGTCWVGWFNEKTVKDALGIGENIRVCDLLPCGYAADDAKPSERHTLSRKIEDVVEYI